MFVIPVFMSLSCSEVTLKKESAWLDGLNVSNFVSWIAVIKTTNIISMYLSAQQDSSFLAQRYAIAKVQFIK